MQFENLKEIRPALEATLLGKGPNGVVLIVGIAEQEGYFSNPIAVDEVGDTVAGAEIDGLREVTFVDLEMVGQIGQTQGGIGVASFFFQQMTDGLVDGMSLLVSHASLGVAFFDVTHSGSVAFWRAGECRDAEAARAARACCISN